jgi:RNA polymerase-binding transcription factor DksA
MNTAEKLMPDMRERLLARQAELEARKRQLDADRQRKTNALSADADDRAIQQENDEVLDGLSEAVIAELVQIAGALERIGKGSYGVCETCRAPIGDKRLAAVPYATQCQRCVAQGAS